MKTGLARVLTDSLPVLRNKRLGLLVNHTAVDERLCHIADLFRSVPGVQLCCLFGPEHGVRGDAQDMVGVGPTKDSVTGLPMYSLYGTTKESLCPESTMLRGLDTVVFDIQDVGSRYYTYAWTLVQMMRVCAHHGVEVVVLDRPNPINGVDVEGGGIDEGYRSFVGFLSVPNRHGMTVGEMAIMANEVESLQCPLTVVPMTGWHREWYYDETGLPWVMPSPNMPSLDAALVYPGMCLVEGTELSEGRGTTRPFELVGAPYVSYAEAHDLVAYLTAENLPGVCFRPVVFMPTFHKFAHRRCGGVQIHVVDRRSFRPYLTGVAVLCAFARMFPHSFQWRTREYEFETERLAIDLLSGSPRLRQSIESGCSLNQLQTQWLSEQEAFMRQREKWMLY